MTKELLSTPENLDLLKRIRQKYKHSDDVQKNVNDIISNCSHSLESKWSPLISFNFFELFCYINMFLCSVMLWGVRKATSHWESNPGHLAWASVAQQWANYGRCLSWVQFLVTAGFSLIANGNYCILAREYSGVVQQAVPDMLGLL